METERYRKRLNTARQSATEKLGRLEDLSNLTTWGCEARRQSRVQRLLTQSQSPLGKFS